MQRSPTACTDWQCRSTGRRSPPPTEARGREPGHVHFICVTCARGAVFTFYLMKSVGGPPSSDELRPVMGASERVARWATGGYKCDVQADGRARVLTPSVWVSQCTSQLRPSYVIPTVGPACAVASYSQCAPAGKRLSALGESSSS